MLQSAFLLAWAGLAAAAPSIFIAGDLTAAKLFNATDPRQGWGEPAHDLFSLNVTNDALQARSTRTFITEGHWTALLSSLSPGDYVVIEFGHNDAHSIVNGAGVLNGTGDETITIQSGPEPEVVQTFGA
ncbi:hypothetical protein BDK51DRAFT_31898 [Blyttiomyces helicus]|uniref:SGNH hydrolase-type esterase domain-containing protein n=1 Tax=Blyttiomyces helicus TaxID=388810 RepID=A0A4P9WDD7_9FUNG|nr:hypothetical protein BDK51DRAFT_31898 [Blyttiomyces helicus]|eukprot:RKO88970.1 hypothetical protein BDK51DRAFT_31898 [Blyttiomyces helicus]